VPIALTEEVQTTSSIRGPSSKYLSGMRKPECLGPAGPILVSVL
jgi:hypothetical protein